MFLLALFKRGYYFILLYVVFSTAAQVKICGKHSVCAAESMDVEPELLGELRITQRSCVQLVVSEVQALELAEVQRKKIRVSGDGGGAGSSVQSTEGKEMTEIKAAKVLRNVATPLGLWTLTTQALMNSGNKAHVEEQREVNRNHVEELKVTLTFLNFFCPSEVGGFDSFVVESV